MLSTKSVDNLQKLFFDAYPNRSKSLQIWVCEGNRACGKFNKSNPNTIFSVGIGTGVSLEKRKNALEITTDGKVYVGDASLGKEVVTTDTMSSAVSNKADKATTLSGYGITDAYTSGQVEARLANLGLLDVASLIEITYADLVDLRNENTLTPGRFYRIVDYITTTTQVETKSAGHQFDIIVLALSKNTLSEDAWAVPHDFYKKDENGNDISNNVDNCKFNEDGTIKTTIEVTTECQVYPAKNIICSLLTSDDSFSVSPVLNTRVDQLTVNTAADGFSLNCTSLLQNTDITLKNNSLKILNSNLPTNIIDISQFQYIYLNIVYKSRHF